MSREKQIEEMAECLIDIQRNFNEYCAKPCRECELGGIVNCEKHYKAEALYNAGYRKQEWISVDEALPAPNTNVLIYVFFHNQWQIVKGWFSWCDKNFHIANSDYPSLTDIPVTHWMPLPDAPKMKGEKNG